MNIFYLDEDPIVSAHYLIDIHVGSQNCGGKMIVESCQMLANCYSTEELSKAPLTKSGKTRKYSYFNHPCSIWVRQSIDNFDWLLSHAEEMIKEKIFRGGMEHFCVKLLQWCRENPPSLKLGFTNPALAMPEEHKTKNPVESYRSYYRTKRLTKAGKRMDVWTKRGRPNWYD